MDQINICLQKIVRKYPIYIIIIDAHEMYPKL